MTLVWPFVPGTVTEHLKFVTDVRKTYAGEMREAFSDAMQSFELNHLLQDQEAARARELFRSGPTQQWYVPVWADGTNVTGIAAGATSIAVSTNADYRVGGKAFIGSDSSTYELVDVTSVGSGIIGVSSVSAAYAAATVAPARLCYATAPLATKTDNVVQSQGITFTSTEFADLGASTYPTLNGFAVVTDPLDSATAVDGGIARAFQLIDSMFGAFSLADTENYTRSRYMLSFRDWDATVRWNRRKFLHYIRGKDKSFYLPTFTQDLAVLVAAASADTSLQVSHVLPSAADYAGRVIYIDNGTATVPLQITSATVSGTTATLLLPAPGISVPTTSRVSFCDLMRLDTDTIDIKHDNTFDGIISTFAAAAVQVIA